MADLATVSAIAVMRRTPSVDKNVRSGTWKEGNLINILGEVSQSGKQRHIPYHDSKLTFLLQESLGGNAKLVVICAVSPSVRCKGETLSTLRFAQHAKEIKIKAVVNETTHDGVNMLKEQVRLLRVLAYLLMESAGFVS